MDLFLLFLFVVFSTMIFVESLAGMSLRII